MSNLVFVTGDFCSGSTLLFTLFRKSGEYYCLYEPLHELLPQYLLWRLRPYQHHYFVENYFDEYKGFNELPKLHQREWGASKLYLSATSEADGLYRYLSYLIGTAFGRSPKVLLKENRFTFRLGWLRAKFPHAKIVHIWRDCEEQWNSNIRRAQAHFGRQDVGQTDVSFNGANIATWCEDLKEMFPILRAENSRSGYERFSRLYELSKTENQRYADISVNYRELVQDFDVVFARIRECVGLEAEPQQLKRFVVPPDQQEPLPTHKGLKEKLAALIDRAGVKQARIRLRLQRMSRPAPNTK